MIPFLYKSIWLEANLNKDNTISRIESKPEVEAFIQNLIYNLDHGSKVVFQETRKVDSGREGKYTNTFTVATLFPNMNPVEALKQELRLLTTENYIQTVKDLKFKNRSEMRVFGKKYRITEDVYIKIRVELFGQDNTANTFVMSFHFAEIPFTESDFPHRKRG